MPLTFHSLKESRDFSRILGGDSRIAGRFFVLFTQPPPGKSPHSSLRLGIIASRKVGQAVERNRIKRVIREVFRSDKAAFLSKNDVVVLVRRGAREKGNPLLREELQILLEKMRREKP
ncbi:MAG: ribonuclease P protein component [Deltaproteobacteria bacterium]|nr:ribonuclease P protein component [Deltaproteobacteria bacterium]